MEANYKMGGSKFEGNDNNAIMTQLLGFGTGTVNFFGRFAYVGTEGHGLSAVAWTERTEPQAAIGSNLRRHAYPDFFNQHLSNNSDLETAFHHPAKGGVVLDLQLRGEYLYAALGKTALASSMSRMWTTRISPSASSPHQSPRSARRRF